MSIVPSATPKLDFVPSLLRLVNLLKDHGNHSILNATELRMLERWGKSFDVGNRRRHPTLAAAVYRLGLTRARRLTATDIPCLQEVLSCLDSMNSSLRASVSTQVYRKSPLDKVLMAKRKWLRRRIRQFSAVLEISSSPAPTEAGTVPIGVGLAAVVAAASEASSPAPEPVLVGAVSDAEGHPDGSP